MSVNCLPERSHPSYKNEQAIALTPQKNHPQAIPTTHPKNSQTFP
ncbi:hypothetical protein QUA00_26250 [Microcoleus sp. T2B6]